MIAELVTMGNTHANARKTRSESAAWPHTFLRQAILLPGADPGKESARATIERGRRRLVRRISLAVGRNLIIDVGGEALYPVAIRKCDGKMPAT